MNDNWQDELKKPFDPKHIDWRIGRGGVNSKGQPWAKCLAYLRRDAIENRLDEAVGPENWRTEHAPGPAGGVMCGLSIRCNGEWVTKWDGADNTDIEQVKGGLSDSFKRAARCWGIGRYLWGLTEDWAVIKEGGQLNGQVKDRSKGTVFFEYDPPTLPSWALPEGYKAPAKTSGKKPPAANGYQSQKSGSTNKSAATIMQVARESIGSAPDVDALVKIKAHAEIRRQEGVIDQAQCDELSSLISAHIKIKVSQAVSGFDALEKITKAQKRVNELQASGDLSPEDHGELTNLMARRSLELQQSQPQTAEV